MSALEEEGGVIAPLRPHQHEMIAACYATWAGGARSVVLQAPPGFGKTHLLGHACAAEVARGRRVLILAGLDTITADTYARCQSYGLDVGLVHADRTTNVDAPILVASWHTLRARQLRPAADLVAIDEAHHTQSDTLRGILADYPLARLLGLTATPERGDGAPLGDLFEYLIPGPQPSWLIERGFLVPYDVLEPQAPEGTTADPVHAYFDHTEQTRCLVFTDRVDTARELAERFAEHGAPAAVLCADTPAEERQLQRAAMREGALRVLINVAVATEGFDLPCIETVILARNFGFVGTYLQAVGRGGRPSPETGKTRCLVLDCARNWRDHGLPDEPRLWQLSGQASVRTEKMLALAKCKQCGAVFPPQELCPRCGAFTKTEAEPVKRKLTRAETALRVSGLPQFEQDQRYLAKLRGVASSRMRMSPERARKWALEQFERSRKRKPAEREHAA